VSNRIPVTIHASDPLSEAGVVAQLRAGSGVQIVPRSDARTATVSIVIAEEIDNATIREIKHVRHENSQRVLLVVTKVDSAGLLAAVEAGVSGIVRRFETTPEALDHAVQAAAAGNGTVAPDLVSRLFEEVGRLQRNVLAPLGLGPQGLTDRETRVLRLLADGCDTAEIARDLCFSERTIKNVIHDVTSRLRVRNRSHAVAFAVREGLI
jgi:DNA-binding NarL/FixJ family response regulator